MNNASNFILALYNYSLLIRDTLEYCGRKPEYNVTAYKQRKEGLRLGLSEGSALSQFIKQNGEEGEKVKKQFEEFAETIYGDNSTIIQIGSDGLRVDHAQQIVILEQIIKCHKIMEDVLFVHMQEARKKNELENFVVDLIKDDERFYRGHFTLAAFDELERSFSEFGKAMNENKGQRSPQANFLEGDCNKLSKFLLETRAYMRITDLETLTMMDQILFVIEMTQGRRDLPEGKHFNDVFKEAKQKCIDYTAKMEKIWKEAYIPVVKEIEETFKRLEQAKVENKA